MDKKYFKYCIAIPAYKEDLTLSEKVSLKRLNDTLKDKDNVYLFCPTGLDVSRYKEIFPELKVEEFSKDNFVSIDAYSHLCMKNEFYTAFTAYEYILLYQLDCYLVEDNIEEWCYKGYDYIGAPILVPHSDWKNFMIDNNNNIVNFNPSVGNGGLSLRKIDTFLYLTDPNSELRQRYELTDDKLASVKYEDVYFCVELSKLYEIEKPKWNEALRFAIDMNPDVAYDQYKLKGFPMGIHAFDKNIPYWRKRIPELSSDEIYECCYEQHKEFIDTYYKNNK